MASLQQTAFTSGKSIPAKYHGFGEKPSEAFAPYKADALFYGKNGVADGTDNAVNDLIGALDAAEYVDNACLYFDGSSYAEFSADTCQLTSDFEIEFWIKKGSVTGSILGKYDTASLRSYSVFVGASITLYTSATGGSPSSANANVTQLDSGWNHIVITKVGTSVTMTTNGRSLLVTGSATETLFQNTTTPFNIGAGITDLTAPLFGVKVTNLEAGVTCLDAPLAEGWGTTIYNRADPTKNGTLVGSTLSTAWGQTQDVLASNIKEGFTLYES